MKDVEKIFVDKMVELLSKQFNKEKWPKKVMDLFQNVVNINKKYVTPELKKHGIKEYSDLYYKIVRRWIRDNYGNGKLALPGDTIKLITMKNDPNPIPPNSTGTVTGINTAYVFNEDHLNVEWDNGRTLSLLVGTDEFEVIEPDNTSLYTQ